MTNKETLKSWFRTGSKPTEKQFWNWQDSYWHKTETIPQSQIQDLDATLANKAEVSALEGKADKSAVYTIRQVDARLESKLNAPEDVFATPSHLIAMGERQERGAEGEAVIKIPISAVRGQDVSSHYLTSVAGAGLQLGANWEIDTAGYYFKIKGLQDKSNDPTFNRTLVLDENNRLAVGKSTGVINNISVNVPQNITVIYPSTIANSNYVPSATTPADIVDTWNLIKQLENGLSFEKFRINEILIQKLPQNKFPTSLQSSGWQIPGEFKLKDGEIHYTGHANSVIEFTNDLQYLSDNEYNGIIFQIMLDKEMPTDKDWIIKLKNFGNREFLQNVHGSFFGFVPTNNEFKFHKSRDFYNYYFYQAFSLWQVNFGRAKSNPLGNSLFEEAMIYVIKVGSKLSILKIDERTGEMALNIYDYDSSFEKYFRFGLKFDRTQSAVHFTPFIVKDISYWIEN